MFKEIKDIKKFNHFYNKTWSIQNLSGAPAFIYACQTSGIFGMKKELGYAYDRFIMEFKDDHAEIYYNRESMHKNYEIYLDKYYGEKNYNKKIWDISEKNFNKLNNYFLKNIHKLDSFDFDKLLKEYHKFFIIFSDCFNASHIVENISLTTDVKLRNDILRELEKRGREKDFNKIFELLTQPTDMPFITEVNNNISSVLDKIYKDKELLKLFKNNKISEKKLRDYKKIYKLITGHIEKYYWMNTTWFGGEELTVKSFIKELKKYIKNNEKVNYISPSKYKKHKIKRKELLKKLKFKKELFDLIEITSFMSYLQDVRKEYILKGVLILQEFSNEISKRIGIDSDDFKYLLTTELDLIKKFSKKELTTFLKNRRRRFGMLHEGGKMLIMDSNTCRAFFNKMDKIKNEKEIKEINGVSASAGKVIGKVNNCTNYKNCENVKKGEILVTSMTRPEFVPAMKRAAAVVTDEGGITCHAAIISRELGIPCVIGTKNATKLLKDGDEVEVNANHGVVKILK